jgi:chemotaxis signal transduction protein
MSSSLYKGVNIEPELAPLIRHMAGANESRESLQNLQNVWDNLSILGHLSATGTDLGHTRLAFQDLTNKLVGSITRECLKNVVKGLRAKAQVAIDILVRNLFERTADVGFLATDHELQTYLQAWHSATDRAAILPLRETLEQRFVEYVAKYSVYFDIIVTDLEGNIAARLDTKARINNSTDPLLQQAATTATFVETFRETDLLDGRRGLLYSAPIHSSLGNQTLGVLTLCFRFENETEGIFSHLQEDNHTVIAYLDAGHRVIDSADPWQLPAGAPLMLQRGKPYQLLYFSGNEYVATLVEAKTYQGYAGPGWFAVALIPMQYAFQENSSLAIHNLSPEILAGAMANPTLFSDELRHIPRQAQLIQSDLNRSVWNGNIRQKHNSESLNNNFSKVLLREISNTGKKAQLVFEQSISRLHETVISAILDNSTFQASLAIDIMDRNLYERANDCRWWALNSFLRQTLSSRHIDQNSLEKLRQALHYINSLYTVYTGIVVFNQQSEIVQVSNPELDQYIGKKIDEEWIDQCLSLRTSQSYVVSDFSESCLYSHGLTYIYAAAISSHSDAHETVGGIGIVFDSRTQFQAMLKDALPTNVDGTPLAGAFGLFVHASGTVLASTQPSVEPGSQITLPAQVFNLNKGQHYSGVFEYEGLWYALGAVMSHGYREYKNHKDSYQNPVAAVVCIPLCKKMSTSEKIQHTQLNAKDQHGSARVINGIEIASFYAGGQWLGIESSHVIESIITDSLTAMPNSPVYLSGVLMYQDNPVPVVDLSALLRGKKSAHPEQVVVIILHAGNNKKIGLLVEQLGEIPVVSQEDLQKLPPSPGSDNSILEYVIKDRLDDKGQMMIVLNYERLKSRVSNSKDGSERIALEPSLVQSG